MEDFIFITLALVTILALYPKKADVVSASEDKVSITLGDKSGKKNAISISSQNMVQKIDKPLMQLKIKKDGKLTKPKKISKKELNSDFSNVVNAMPKKTFNTNIFFKTGIVLNDNYIIKIFQIKNEIKRRTPCEVDIIGYSDTKGPDEANLIVSRKRAILIKKLLEATKIDLPHINIFAYGETNQFIPTKDGVQEPKNRRVEVIIR
jgi:outer membrane protein OmpA-like peptidoglycan-associated protein